MSLDMISIVWQLPSNTFHKGIKYVVYVLLLLYNEPPLIITLLK